MSKSPNKIKMKDKWFFVLAFIPFLQWICCFLMYTRSKSRKYVIFGFISLLLIVIYLSVGALASNWYTTNRMDSPEGSPKSSNYGINYQDPNYSNSDAYKQYQADLNAYESSEEYHNVNNYNRRLSQQVNGINNAANTVFYLTCLLFMILVFFIERPRYYKALKGKATKEKILNSFEPDSRNVGVSDDPLKGNKLVNPNFETEDGLARKLGISVMDAKKIIAYRDKYGSFFSVDDFFQSFDAKPHVVAKLQNRIIVDESSDLNPNNDQQNIEPANEPQPKGNRFDI